METDVGLCVRTEFTTQRVGTETTARVLTLSRPEVHKDSSDLLKGVLGRGTVINTVIGPAPLVL